MRNYELSRFIIHVKDYEKSVPADKVTDRKVTDYRVYGLARVDCILHVIAYLLACISHLEILGEILKILG